MSTPTRFFELFTSVTKPSDWQGDMPKIDALYKLIDEPTVKLKEALPGKLDERAIIHIIH